MVEKYCKGKKQTLKISAILTKVGKHDIKFAFRIVMIRTDEGMHKKW